MVLIIFDRVYIIYKRLANVHSLLITEYYPLLIPALVMIIITYIKLHPLINSQANIKVIVGLSYLN